MKSHLDFFGLENFRIFDKPTMLEFKPITIFTGPNSSGKSTVFKALNLFQYNKVRQKFPFSELKIDLVKHQLGNFEQILSNSTNKSYFILTLPITFPIDQIEEPSDSTRKWPPPIFKRIMNSELKPLVPKEGNPGFPGNPWRLELLYEGTGASCILWNLRIFNNKDQELYSRNFQEYIEEYGRANVKVFNHRLDLQLLYQVFKENFELKVDNALNEFLPLEDFICQYQKDVYKKGNKFEKRIQDIEMKVFIKEYSNGFIDEFEEVEGMPLFSGIDRKIFNLKTGQLILSALSKKIQKALTEAGIKAEVTGLTNTFNGFINFVNVLFKKAGQLTESDFLYLPSIRGNIHRLYPVEPGETPINEILHDYTKSPKANRDFVRKWVKVFGVGDDVKVETTEGVVNAPYIIRGEEKILLADLGFGVTQLLPMLMMIATGKDVMIEEPEANLHPKLQSKLAEMFVDFVEQDRQLLIETHSEYLIRKLQYLVGDGKLSPDDVIIHYFNEPGSKEKVRTIHIEKDGSLSDDFGSGFFDETINLKLELLKLKNLQKN